MTNLAKILRRNARSSAPRPAEVGADSFVLPAGLGVAMIGDLSGMVLNEPSLGF